jgi:hypothetical protein
MTTAEICYIRRHYFIVKLASTYKSDDCARGQGCSTHRCARFAFSQGSRVVVKCIAVRIMFVLAVFKEGAGNFFLSFPRHVKCKRHVVTCKSKFCCV